MRTCVTALPSSRLFTSGFTVFSRHSTSSAARPPAGGPPVSSQLRPRPEPCAVGHVEDRDGTVPRLGHASLQEAHRADGLGCLSSPDRARKSEKSRGRKFVPHHPLPFFSVKTTGMRMRTVRPGLPQREAARATAAQASRSSMSWPLPSWTEMPLTRPSGPITNCTVTVPCLLMRRASRGYSSVERTASRTSPRNGSPSLPTTRSAGSAGAAGADTVTGAAAGAAATAGPAGTGAATSGA